jgi:hypothetical protein
MKQPANTRGCQTGGETTNRDNSSNDAGTKKVGVG